ncbi:MAG: CCA tRNA nucleotidyltransferase [Caedimonadaceae bacterium]|nr:MAG: CCA tRNA nucleotidyltransferase [Caedimonadaceae bacterium]
MKVSKSIEIQPWMRSLEVQKLFSVFESAHTNLRFVGGVVRDALSGRPIDDIDLATILTPDVVMTTLTQAGITMVPTGLKHGTVTAVINNKHFEITTLRTDVSSDGRHAEVEYTNDWLKDAMRRDFTFNAMYLSYDGELFDPFDGLSDLKSGIVRFIGNPTQRITEDYLRILRFFRFFAYFGKNDPDERTLQSIVELKEGLNRISSERIHKEFFKLIEATNPIRALETMQVLSIMQTLFKFDGNCQTLSRLITLEDALGLKAAPLRRLLALFEGHLGSLGEAMDRMKLSNAEKHTIVTTGYARAHLTDPLNILFYQWGPRITFHAFMLQTASDRTSHAEATKHLQVLMNQMNDWIRPTFPLKGEDLIDLGVPEGPMIGTLIQKAEMWWLQNRCSPSREACLNFLKEHLARH